MPVDEALSSRERLLRSAKKLFAAQGFEQVSTSEIARSAGSSESQLVKHFGGKQGLLEAIFSEAWDEIVALAQQAFERTASPVERLWVVAETFLTAVERDPEIQFLILMEGRRVRREGLRITLTEGFLRFVGLLDDILAEMSRAGLLRADVHPQAVRSTLMGVVEGLLRDRALASVAGYCAQYDLRQVPTIFHLVLGSFLENQAPKPALTTTESARRVARGRRQADHHQERTGIARSPECAG